MTMGTPPELMVLLYRLEGLLVYFEIGYATEKNPPEGRR